jgi:hypothetical protein
MSLSSPRLGLTPPIAAVKGFHQPHLGPPRFAQPRLRPRDQPGGFPPRPQPRPLPGFASASEVRATVVIVPARPPKMKLKADRREIGFSGMRDMLNTQMRGAWPSCA